MGQSERLNTGKLKRGRDTSVSSVRMLSPMEIDELRLKKRHCNDSQMTLWKSDKFNDLLDTLWRMI